MNTREETIDGVLPADNERPIVARRYLVLVLLLMVAIVNMIDKAVVTVLTDPIKREFGLSDAELGLLGGLSFGVFFSLVGIPLGRIADRGNRRTLIAASVFVWSAATVGCGVAANFLQLLIFRFVVGGGESGSGPAALSMISDLFRPRERATAVGFYYLATPIGTAIALSFGGWAIHAHGWRWALIMAGVPGLVLAAVFLLLVREPVRSEAAHSTGDAEIPSLGQTLRYIASQPSLLHVMTAIALLTTAINGFGMWIFPFFTRVAHIPAASAGWQISLATNPISAVTILLSGYLADRLARTEERWRVWVPAIIAALCLPAAYAAVSATDAVVGLAFTGLWMVGATSWYGAGYAVCQSLVQPRMRATLMSILLLLTTLVGFGIGPVLAGLISDAMAPHVGERSIGYGMVGTNILALWAAVHFFLAARTLRSDLARAGQSG